ncbi:hypothetical protein GCM10010293_08600 [Streptomyces griseoflavus]|nr:hypothetical protein GCM10010293_08600 [Streptomyces griseoflavus]
MVAKKTARGTEQADPAAEPTPEKIPPAGGTAVRGRPPSAEASGERTAKAPARTPSGKKTGRKAAPASKKTATGKTAAGKASAEEAPSAKAARGGAERTPAGKTAERTADGGQAGRRAAGEAATAGTSGSPQDVAGHSAADDAGAAEAAAQTGVTTVGAKKTPGPAATAEKTAVPQARFAEVEPGELAVRPGEEPWTTEEVEEARAELMSEVLRLREEITNSEQALAGLMRDSGDGAGDDDADTGTKNITREHELALAANAREMLSQFERAHQRLDAGTYGLCENCGDPIGKARMQAFPRATLCVECKQKQERRY